MPKVAWGSNFGKDVVDAETEFNEYDGPVPPKGVYAVSFKKLYMKINKSGDHMFSGVFDINEPKGSAKAKYNGYGMWWQGNVNEQGAGYINKFLDVIGADRKKFWANGVIYDDKDGGTKPTGDSLACTLGTVTSISGIKIKPGTLMKVTGREDSYGEGSLKVGGFLPTGAGNKTDAEEDEDDVEDEDDDLDIEDVGEDDEVEEDEEEDGDIEGTGDEFDEDALLLILEPMDLKELKAYARSEYKVKITELRNLDDDGVIDLILEKAQEAFEAEADEEEPEPEPEPAKPARRARGTRAAKPAADEPPF